MTKDEALKLALEFIENSECGTADLEARIKKALAQPEQEPVAWMWDVNNGAGYSSRGVGLHKTDIPFAKHTPLYTTPPQRKPLTDEEIEKCYETTGHYQTLRPQDRFAVFALARAIEAAHGIKEKNT